MMCLPTRERLSYTSMHAPRRFLPALRRPLAGWLYPPRTLLPLALARPCSCSKRACHCLSSPPAYQKCAEIYASRSDIKGTDPFSRQYEPSSGSTPKDTASRLRSVSPSCCRKQGHGTRYNAPASLRGPLFDSSSYPIAQRA